MRSLETAAGQTLGERRDRSGEGRVRVTSVRIDAPGRRSGSRLGSRLRFDFGVSRSLPGLDCAFSVYDTSGNLVPTSRPWSRARSTSPST